jgi:serine phosphatase RsbU (regulator of sigma subunit)
VLTESHTESQSVFKRIIRSSPGILFHLEVDLLKKEEHYLFISENYADLFEVEIQYAKTHKLLQTTLTAKSMKGFMRDFYSTVSSCNEIEMEIEIHTPKGNTKWIKMRATIERHDHLANLFGIYLDITDEKEKFLKQERITTTLLTLNKHPSVHSGNIGECMQVITQSLSEALDIARVSIWKYNDDKTEILCLHLYEQASDTHTQGGILSKNDFAPYFDYLEKNAIVKAFDAEIHEATSCFSKPYLQPLGIKTIVDVPIYHNNRIYGVLCCENTGQVRTYESNEIQMMANVTEIYSYAFSLSEQNAYKQELEYMNLNLNSLVEERTHALEMKSKEVIDSINYAQRIQRVILPSENVLNERLLEHFIIYKPKDIVSGDFYWFSFKDNALIIACADCTGHGVPGSLVSLICHNELSSAIDELGADDPALILDSCRVKISKIFNSGNDTIRDGMDISLMIVDPLRNSFSWAGANSPLWFTQNQELKILKGDKQHAGYCENPLPFTTHTVQLNGTETFYLFSDGFADQFGGEAGKKYKTAAFKALIEQICHLPLNEQEEKINASFHHWKQDLEQVDDVSIIGVRLTDSVIVPSRT